MSKKKEFTIPFGAKDSELVEETYFIPEGMEAIIDGDKVIIRKKESEDEKIRKEIKDFFSRIMLGQENFLKEDYDWNAWIAWLENQGDNRLMKALQEANKKIGELVEENYYLKEQGEQKPAEKVEPKFKIEKGKWYVCIKDLLDNYANKAFCEGDTYLSTQDGSLIPSNRNVPFEVVSQDTYFRDWTIQDAKDGDVLVDSLGNVCIYQEPSTKLMYHSYCYESHKCFIDMGGSHEIVGSSPATKEQRDQLEKAMADAGWEFDFEKKELKKIEQNPEEHNLISLKDFQEVFELKAKQYDINLPNRGYDIHAMCKELYSLLIKQNPAWSEEDEEMLKNILSSINHDSVMEGLKSRGISYSIDSSEHLMENLVGWLKSLKERVQPQYKQEWSKEDDGVLLESISVLWNNSYWVLADKLKSLKDRYTWSRVVSR